MNIQNKHLNLLPIFEALYESGSVSAAAKFANLSQPALSHALKNLRNVFNDDLFVRSSTGMTPTDRAREIWPAIKQGLDVLRHTLEHRDTRDPKQWRGILRIASTEYFEVLSLPTLIQKLSQTAPQLRLHAKPVGRELPRDDLENGNCDLAIAGFFSDLPPGFYKTKLFSDRFVGVARKQHPILERPQPDLKLFLEFPHLLLSPAGDFRSLLDQKLADLGHKRQIVAGTTSFLTPAWVIAESDALLVTPERLARSYAKFLPISSFEIPIKLDPITIVQVWHERTHRSPAHQWIRKFFVENFVTER